MLAMELEKVYAAHRKKSSSGGKSEAVGVLETLWDWASKYAIQGDIGKWPDDVIAHGIGWLYSGKELISALITSRWVDVAPEPFRLTIHDIQDHAQNCWRQNLENAGLTWWDGTPARKYKLQKSPKALQEKSNYPPQPEPETKPETEEEKKSTSTEVHKPTSPIPSGPGETDAPFALNPPPVLRPAVPANGNGHKSPTKAWYDGEHKCWYAAYWNHKAPQSSRRAFEKAVVRLVYDVGLTHEQASEFLRDAVAADRARFEPTSDWEWRCKLHPATWLNGSRWTDEASPEAPPRARPAKQTAGQMLDEIWAEEEAKNAQ